MKQKLQRAGDWLSLLVILPLMVVVFFYKVFLAVVDKVRKNFWLKYVMIPRKIKMYRDLLWSDRYFSEDEYRYFGSQIYKLRKRRKEL